MPALNDVYRLVAYCLLDTRRACVTRTYDVMQLEGTGVTDFTVATGWQLHLGNALPSLMTSAALWYGVAARRVWPLPVQPEVFSFIDFEPGLVVGGALPTQVAGVLVLRTAEAAVRHYSRAWAPYPGKADSAGGSPTTSYLSRLDALGSHLTSSFFADAPGGSGFALMRPVIWSGGTGRVALSSWSSRPRWGTQRRRGREPTRFQDPIGS